MPEFVSDDEAKLALAHPNEFTRSEQDLVDRLLETRKVLLQVIDELNCSSPEFCGDLTMCDVCQTKQFAQNIRYGS